MAMADDAVERGGDYAAVDENSPLLLNPNEKPVSAVGSGGGYFGSFPGSIKYLVWNEFCERFSFYGMKTILALYLVQHLRLSENESTELVHLFIVACYATPLLGAFISDCYWVRTSSPLCKSLNPELPLGFWFLPTTSAGHSQNACYMNVLVVVISSMLGALADMPRSNPIFSVALSA